MSRSATRWQPTARAATTPANGPAHPATALTAAQREALHRVYTLILPPYWEIPSVVAAIKAANAEQTAKDAAAKAAADANEPPTAPAATVEPQTGTPPLTPSPSLCRTQ